MWGFFVEMAGVGPKACPVNKLTVEILAEKMKQLSSTALKEAAEDLAKEMAEEDGIEGGYIHFIDSLWRDNMLCDVSLLLGETRQARYCLLGSKVGQYGVKVSSEVAAVLEGEHQLNWNSLWNWLPACWNKVEDHQWYAAGIKRHAVTSFSLCGRIKTVQHGIFAGFWALIYGIVSAIFQPYVVSDKYARHSGSFGCLFGLIFSVYFILKELVVAVLVFFDRIIVGITNGIFGMDYDYVLDPSWKAQVHPTPLIEAEMEATLKQGVPKARRRELMLAMDFVVGARVVFHRAKPRFPKDHSHFHVVKLTDLLEAMESLDARMRLRLTDEECKKIEDELRKIADIPPMSYRRKVRNSFMIEHLRRRSLTRIQENKNHDSGISDITMSAMDLRSSLGELESGLVDVDLKEGDSTPVSGSAEKPALASEKSTDTIFKNFFGKITGQSQGSDLTRSRELNDDDSDHTGGGETSIYKELMKAIRPLSYAGRPEDTEVSFSLFIQALQSVVGQKVLEEYKSFRSTNILATVREEISAWIAAE